MNKVIIVRGYETEADRGDHNNKFTIVGTYKTPRGLWNVQSRGKFLAYVNGEGEVFDGHFAAMKYIGDFSSDESLELWIKEIQV